MIGRRGLLLTRLRDAEEQEQRRGDAAELGEILGAGRFLDIVGPRLAAGDADQRRRHLGGQRRVVRGHVIDFGDLGLGLGAGGLGNRGGGLRDALMHVGAHALVEGAQRAFEHHLVGDDVVADAAVDLADRDDRRLLRNVELAADDGLQAVDDLRRGNDRIDAAPGQRAMRLAAGDGHRIAVGRGHQRPRAPGDGARLHAREDVQAEHRVGLGISERPLLDHRLGAPGLAGAGLEVGRAFLGGLEQEHDLAGQVLLHPREDLGGRHQDRHVRVVAAGVHDRDGLAAVGAGRLALERQAEIFLHRQRVHVGPQRNGRPGLAAFEDADDAGLGDAGLYLHAELLQMVGDDLGASHLGIAELGMLVEVAAPGQHLGFDGLRGAVGGGGRRGGRGRLRSRAERERQREKTDVRELLVHR